MLLAIDIGNTTIAIGLFRGKKLLRDWRLETDREKTCDEYAVLMHSLFQMAGVSPRKLEGLIISSVVPPLTPVIEALGENVFGVKPLVVGPGLRTGLPILYENPAEVGADRIVAAVAAFEKYGGPAIVVDFGTATTFDAITAKGEYLGGSIAPGIQIAAEALYRRTAKLPRIEIRKPRKAIGRSTVASMQSGLYFGYIGLVSTIIAQVKKELGGSPTVIATGGFGGEIVPEVPAITAHEPTLVLEGLRIIYERNKGG
ncbi:MAG: type III pantothenate kinase [Candidatus Aminicenantes bacterium]|nr:type III pantothenate kinase [Candidatus Aminicenantes bacterium]